MIKHRRIAHWTVIVGLVTGVLALVTAFFALQERLNSVDAKAKQVAEDQQDLARRQAAYEKERQIDVAAQKAILDDRMAAQERARICDNHQRNLSQVEDRFAVLTSEHGVLLNIVKSCVDSGSDDDKAKCVAAVCVAAGVVYGTNCANVGADAAAIAVDLERVRSAAVADSCTMGESPANRYFNG